MMRAIRLIIPMMLVAGCLPLCREASADESAGHVMKIVGKAYWRKNPESPPSALDPKRDYKRPLHAGEAVRCEPGCVLTLELYGTTVSIKKTSWYPIPAAPPSEPSAPEASRPGGRVAGVQPATGILGGLAGGGPGAAAGGLGLSGTKTVQVERAEVLLVQGNDLVVKMEDGTIRHIPNIPDSARVDVDGKELAVQDLKPGMRLERTLTTLTTPRVITNVETVKGRVFHVSPPTSLILTLENGQNQQFKMPEGQKFNVKGKTVDAFALRKGMMVTATRVTEIPETMVAQHKELTGHMPPAPPADLPILVSVATSPSIVASAEAPAAEAAPEKLPKTGSLLPTMGLLGVVMVALGLCLRAVRPPR